MAKSSIFARFINIFKAETHAQLDKLENTENALNQEARNFASAMQQMESSTAESIGALRMAEGDYNAGVAEHKEFGLKAQAALKKAASLSESDPEKSARFEDAARTLLSRQIELEQSLTERQQFIVNAQAAVEQQKANVAKARDQYTKLIRKRDELVNRARTAESMGKMQESMSEIDTSNVNGQLGRLENKIRKNEAKVLGTAEMAANSGVSEMASIEAMVVDDELERRLAGLKGGENVVKALTAF